MLYFFIKEIISSRSFLSLVSFLKNPINKFNKYLDITESEFVKILNNNKSTDYIFLKTKSGINKKNKIGFHPGLTLFFSEIKDNIKKFDSGFWKKKN